MEPLFEQLAGELLFTPDPPRGVEDPQQVPAVRTVSYGDHQDHQLPAPAEPVEVLARIDGWCEDRPQEVLSDDDGRE